MAAVSRKKTQRVLLSFIFALSLIFGGAPLSWCSDSPSVPVPDTVTLADFGSHSCVPCIMMAPILKELKTEYKGKAEILFIDVWEDRDLAGDFNIRTIPTQIFFDSKGNEITRHQGFMSREAMVSELDKLLSR